MHYDEWKVLYFDYNFTEESDLNNPVLVWIMAWHWIGIKPLSEPMSVDQGAVSIRKTVLPGMAIPMLKIRRPNGSLIFNMEIAIRR